MSLLPALRRSTVGASRALVRGGGGGPAPPPFARLPAPAGRLAEENELLWNDSVAPEITIDFDAPNFSAWKSLGLLGSAIGTLGLLFMFVDKVVDPPSKKPCVQRELPYNYSNEIAGYNLKVQ